MPPTWEERITLYVTYLIVKGNKSTTIKSYLSAIRAVLADDGYQLHEPKLLLASLTKTCRIKFDKVKRRFPIHKSLMDLILVQIERMYEKRGGQIYLVKLYQCMIVLGYYGLLRIGEMATGDHPVKARDIHFDYARRKILLVLFTSKTHGFHAEPQKIKIWADSNCTGYYPPFKVTREFLQLRGGYRKDNEPLFVFQDKSPVRPHHFRTILRRALKRLGLDAKLYDTHSLRIGRASDLMKLGVNIDKIRQNGRWKSNTVYKYLRI